MARSFTNASDLAEWNSEIADELNEEELEYMCEYVDRKETSKLNARIEFLRKFKNTEDFELAKLCIK